MEKLAGGHTGRVTGVIDSGTLGGSREEKGVSRKVHDGSVSHVIDWPPCCACRGDHFSLRSGETRAGGVSFEAHNIWF